MVEHLTADQEVPGSNPGAPCSVANFGNIKFSTSKQGCYYLFFCQTDLSNFFSVDEDKIFRKSGHQFFTFEYGGFWKNQSPDFQVKPLLFDVVKMKYVNSLKTQSLDFKSRQIKRFTGSNPAAPFGLGIFGTFKVWLLMLSKSSM